MLKLYEFGPSRSIRARWTLQEIGVPFESVPVNLRTSEHRTEAFLRINPAGKVPVLIDGDVVLTESVAIALYLADKFPEARLSPTDLVGRGRVQQWCLFAATEMEQPLWRIAKHRRFYPKNQRIPADIPLAGEDFVTAVRVLDGHMRDRSFVAADMFTVADIVVAYTLDWANELDLLDGMSALGAYMERMYQRPNAAAHRCRARGSASLNGGDGRCRRAHRTRQPQRRRSEQKPIAPMRAQPVGQFRQIPHLA